MGHCSAKDPLWVVVIREKKRKGRNIPRQFDVGFLETKAVEDQCPKSRRWSSCFARDRPLVRPREATYTLYNL